MLIESGTEVTTILEKQFDAAVVGVAFADRSSVGRIEIKGADRLDLLHRLSTNALVNARPGQIVGTVLTTDKGRVIDYVQILVRDASLLALTSESGEARFEQWIDKYTITEDISLRRVTDETSQYTLVGPKAKEFIETVVSQPLVLNRFVDFSFDFGTAILAYRSEFSTDFVECIVPSDSASKFESLLQSKGTAFNLQKMENDSIEAFRISRGMPRANHELTESYNPYESGLLHAISFTKGCYIGQEVIARLDTYQKVQKQMVGIVFSHKPDVRPKAGCTIRDAAGTELGILTSVSPIAIKGVVPGITILKKSFDSSDNTVWATWEDESVSGTIRQLPLTL